MMHKLSMFAMVFALMATAGAQVAPNPRAKAGPVLLQNPPPPELVEMWRVSQKSPLALTVYLDDDACRAKLKGKAHTLILQGSGQVSEEEYLHELCQWYAVERLGDVGGEDAIPHLEQYAALRQSQGDEDKAFAARLAIERIRLRLIGQEAYKRAMLEWIQIPDPPRDAPYEERKKVYWRIMSGARALGVIGAKEAAPLLVDRYQRSIGGRFPEDFFLVRSLARLGDSRSLPVLSWAIRNFVGYTQAQRLPLEPDEPDVVWAYWQIRTQGMSAREAAREVLKAAEAGEGNLRGQNFLPYLGKEAVPELVAALERALQSGGSIYTPFVAILALRQMGVVEAAPVLRALLERSAYPNIRAAAAYTLGVIRDKEAVPLLLQAAQREELGVRQSAIRALSDLRTPRAEPVLLKLLQEDPDPNIRVVAAEAMARVGAASSIPVLESLLNTEKVPGVIGAIRTSLAKLKTVSR
jgi:HEAT repeat protein